MYTEVPPPDDADLYIVRRAEDVKMKESTEVTVIGEDIDLLVLLVALTTSNSNIFFLKPGKSSKSVTI